MFRLEKLQINGFKSFYDPAEILFPASLTAIVGPNGCGKSNISDALIWVLGEHRASNIRGEKMEDVIFQGSERRKALGMGEATITLQTSGEHPAAEDGRIVISRRVYRSGESEFRLNGKRVRLKDISDILMDTGLGIRNYSVMEQGKIDLIVSNKPQDRRKLIEEAAGITKYKTKRRAAELKLDETQANLVRIDDTLAEVTRNLNSLKRQAAKARRHKELVDQLAGAKRSLYAGRILAARAESGESEAAVVVAQNLESESAAILGGDEALLAETRTQFAERSSQASALREELARLGSEAERLRSFLAQSETNLTDLTQRNQNARAQVASIEVDALEQQNVLAEKGRALEGATVERDRLRAVSEEHERDRQAQGDAVRTMERELATSRELQMKTIARISESRNQLHQLEIAVEKCDFYLGKLIDTAKKASEELSGASQRMTEWQQAVADAETALAAASAASKAALELRDELAARRQQTLDTLKSTRDSISQTTYRIDSLRSLLTSLESQDEDVRRAILEFVPHVRSAAESVSAAPGFESALDTLLRDITRALVVDDSRTAIDAIRRLHERGAGRGAFLAIDFTPDGGTSIRTSIADAIVGDGPIADAVRSSVPEAFVVDSLEAATVEARRKPDATFITRDGDIVRGPLMIGGKKEGTRGIFEIKRQLHDLEQLLSNEEQKATGIASQLETLERELADADEARIFAEETARQAESELRDKVAARDRVRTELQRFEQDLAVATEERSLYEDERRQLEQRRVEATTTLQTQESAERETHQRIADLEQGLTDARARFETITEVASSARVELETAIGNVNATQREYENFSRIVASLTQRYEQLQSEIASLDEKIGETGVAADAARVELDGALTKHHEVSERRVTLEAEVAELEASVTGLEAKAVASRADWNAKRDHLFEAERRLDRASSALDLLREQLSLDLHCTIDMLDDALPPESDEARGDLDSKVTQLAEQIERIGPVNVLAIEEYKELEEREHFLRTQRDDLVQAIESLRQTIRKINVTSRELFREAFTAVNLYFIEIFQSLFGGGRAGIQLLDEEDILESGIEIIAQPPGKKTQSITLLSGGERALTALALLFAIFRYKPSPFCLLDEVDAPLDEVNNERFVRLVRQMSSDTQFIVITHSKRTMEAAEALYGVTMEEAGCSRLVSVNFAEMEA
ncbi:MAG: chromosome segregation protein SMC [Thermoanaerobaculia bacterium]